MLSAEMLSVQEKLLREGQVSLPYSFPGIKRVFSELKFSLPLSEL